MVAKDTLDVDHSDQDKPRGHERRRKQQADKSAEKAEDDLCRQGQRRRQVHGPALHQRDQNVALDEVHPEIERDHIYRERQVYGGGDDNAGNGRNDAADITERRS